MLRQLRGRTVSRLLRAQRTWSALEVCALSGSRRFHLSTPTANERPWYVTEARNLAPKHQEVAQVPATPSEAPEFMGAMLQHLSQELGLKDLKLVDARESLSMPGWMVIGTGTSQKHLGAAAQELASELKKSHGIVASKTGVLTPNFLRVHARRQRRRAQHQRTVGPSQPLTRIDPWVVLDTHQGVLVHLMTADRRASLDLETLFTDDVNGEFNDEVDEEFLEPRRAPTSPNTLGQRRFHTTAYCREQTKAMGLLTKLESDGEVTRELVDEFKTTLPSLPSRQDWRINLAYFSMAATLGPEQFIDDLLEAAIAQQSAGHVLDKHDVERVLSGICYNGQFEFRELLATPEYLERWHALCDHKSRAIAELHSFTCETTGTPFLTDPRIAVLLYRSFFAPVEHAEALPEDRLFWDRRLRPLLEVVKDTDEILTMPVLRMVLNSLANGGTWGTFWRVLANLQLRSAFSTLFLEEILETLVSARNAAQINHALQVFVPSSILRYRLTITPRLITRLNEALDIVDPKATSFRSLREYMNIKQAPH